MIDMPGYIDLLRLLKESALVLTDSAEFEAELTVMNVPCITLRQSTARPSTVELGTNVLIDPDEAEILERATAILSGKQLKKTLIPEMGRRGIKAHSRSARTRSVKGISSVSLVSSHCCNNPAQYSFLPNSSGSTLVP